MTLQRHSPCAKLPGSPLSLSLHQDLGCRSCATDSLYRVESSRNVVIREGASMGSLARALRLLSLILQGRLLRLLQGLLPTPSGGPGTCLRGGRGTVPCGASFTALGIGWLAPGSVL